MEVFGSTDAIGCFAVSLISLVRSGGEERRKKKQEEEVAEGGVEARRGVGLALRGHSPV